jgi:FAD synthetase
MKKRVVVFGIFDGVHDGHRDMFRQALEYGDELVVIVGRDEVALELKGKRPKYGEGERVAFVKAERLVSDAVLGDDEQSSYAALESLKPNIICLGYDQDALEEDLQTKSGGVPTYRLKPYKPDALHNSKLI